MALDVQDEKILWVDDTFTNELHDLMAYVDELEGSQGGFVVCKVFNSDDALKLLEQKTEVFVCIILDIMLPYGERISPAEAQAGNITGLVLKERIRQIDKYKDVPIVMFTGVRNDKMITDYFKNNSDTCFYKADISAEEFRNRIKKLVGDNK